MRGEPLRRLFLACLSIAAGAFLSSCTIPTPENEEDPVEPAMASPSPVETPRHPAIPAETPMTSEVLPPIRSTDPAFPFKGSSGPDEVLALSRPAGSQRTVSFESDSVLQMQRKIVAENPTNDNEKLKLASLYLLNRNYPEAEGVLTGLQNRSHPLLPFYEAYLYGILGEHKAAADRVDRILQNSLFIEGFKIERCILCNRISGYRRYEPNAAAQVLPGGIIAIYVEPRNFALKEENGRYKLWLRYDWRLYNDRMEEIPVPVWQSAKPADREDLAFFEGSAREFYQSFRLPLPSNLPIGEYRVKVSVEDRNQGKMDSQFLAFRVPAVMAPENR